MDNLNLYFLCRFYLEIRRPKIHDYLESGWRDEVNSSRPCEFEDWEQHITDIFDICNKDDNIKEHVEQELTRFEQTCFALNQPNRIIQLAFAIRDFCKARKLTNIKLEGCQEKPHIVLPKKSKPLAYLGYLALMELWYSFTGCKTFWTVEIPDYYIKLNGWKTGI